MRCPLSVIYAPCLVQTMFFCPQNLRHLVAYCEKWQGSLLIYIVIKTWRRSTMGWNPTLRSILETCFFAHWLEVVYDQNHYFGLGPIPKRKPKLADTFGRYRNWYRNYILILIAWGIFFHHKRAPKIKFSHFFLRLEVM